MTKTNPQVDGLVGVLVKRFTKGKISIGTLRGEYTGNGERLISHLHAAQLRVAHDTSTRICVTCGRRAGKTVLDAALLARVAENYPNALCIYITITRKSAKRIIWPELKRLNRAYSADWKFNEVESYVTAPNGSVIVVAGADKREEIEKFRGLAPSVVILDEVKSFKGHLEELIEEVLEPGLMDYKGQLILTGTPGRVPSGFFWSASADPLNVQWSRHSWTVIENPMAPQWAGAQDWRDLAKEYLAGVLRDKGWRWDNPKFQREQLGRWCRDVSNLLYKYDPQKNHADALPSGHEWRFVMGIDLGSKGTAFVLWAYSPTLNVAYAVWAEKHEAMLLGGIIERGRALERQFSPIMGRVIDEGGLGKMINAFLNREGFACMAAEKQNKLAFIEALNDDLDQGRVVVLPTASVLVDEWTSLELAEDGGEKLHSNNHCSDAALYSWRRCRHYLPVSVGDPRPGDKGYDDWAEEQMWKADEPRDEGDLLFKRCIGGEDVDFDGDSSISRIMSAGWGAAD